MHTGVVIVIKTALAGLLLVGLAACSSSPSAPATPTHNDADSAFVLHMLPHHKRALEVGQLAASKGSDPRVVAFGQRIMSEQTPEEQKLESWVSELKLTQSPGDAAMADGYIDDASLARLQSETGTTFDRDVLLLSAQSETGAAAMSALELKGGVYDPAKTLATSISTAPNGEIPELRQLAAALPA